MFHQSKHQYLQVIISI